MKSHECHNWTRADAAKAPLLDDLVGAAEQSCRHGKAKHSCGLHVDEQLDARCPLHRQVGWLFAFEDARGIDPGNAE
jgi:hypothetical protein